MNKLDVFLQDSFFYIAFRKRIIENVVSDYFNDYLGTLEGKTVLEIGSGNGHGASLIEKYFRPKKIAAIDLDSRLVDIAKRNITSPIIDFEVADATKLRFENKTFDAVFDFGVIHHIPDWENCLQELHRVLKPKGMLFMYDVPIESFNTLWGHIVKTFTLHPYRDMFTKNEFIAYLNKLGFKTLTNQQYKSSLVYFVIVAQK